MLTLRICCTLPLKVSALSEEDAQEGQRARLVGLQSPNKRPAPCARPESARKKNTTLRTPAVHACSTLMMPPAHRRQLRPTGAERPGLTKQKQDRRHLARRRIAARERQLTATICLGYSLLGTPEKETSL